MGWMCLDDTLRRLNIETPLFGADVSEWHT